MKIVWFGQEKHLAPSLNHLRFSLSKITDLVAYGYGEAFIPEFNALKIVKKENPDAIFIGSNQYKFKNLKQVQIPKALKLGDPHANYERHCKWLKENNVYPLSVFGDWIPKYEKCFGKGNVGWLPYTIDHEIYPNMGLKRIIDVFYASSPIEGLHPIRYAMGKSLPKIRRIKSFTPKEYLSDSEWIRTINKAKIFAFDSSRYKYAVPKFYEGFACGAAVMATRPADAERLHFVKDENYIEVTSDDWFSKLQYYLTHPKELEELTNKGYKTYLKYHTSDVRAKELLGILKGLVK